MKKEEKKDYQIRGALCLYIHLSRGQKQYLSSCLEKLSYSFHFIPYYFKSFNFLILQTILFYFIFFQLSKFLYNIFKFQPFILLQIRKIKQFNIIFFQIILNYFFHLIQWAKCPLQRRGSNSHTSLGLGWRANEHKSREVPIWCIIVQGLKWGLTRSSGTHYFLFAFFFLFVCSAVSIMPSCTIYMYILIYRGDWSLIE